MIVAITVSLVILIGKLHRDALAFVFDEDRRGEMLERWRSRRRRDE